MVGQQLRRVTNVLHSEKHSISEHNAPEVFVWNKTAVADKCSQQGILSGMASVNFVAEISMGLRPDYTLSYT